MLDSGLWVHNIPTAKLTPTRHRLDWTGTSQRKLCLIQCSDARKVSLSMAGKTRHFLHAVRSGNSDTHSASARCPQAQSYFTTQMSTRRDRWNNPAKPDCTSAESKQDVREPGYSAPTSAAFHYSVSHVRKKKSKKQNWIYWQGHKSEVLLLVGGLNQTYHL